MKLTKKTKAVFQPGIFYVLNKRTMETREKLHKRRNKDFIKKVVTIVTVLHTKCSRESQNAMISIVWLFAWRQEKRLDSIGSKLYSIWELVFNEVALEFKLYFFRLMMDIFVKYWLQQFIMLKKQVIFFPHWSVEWISACVVVVRACTRTQH